MSSWQNRRLGEVAEMCLGKMLDKNKNKGELQPYLANINVRWGSFELNSLNNMRFEKSEQERYGLKFGDIVVCEGGEPGRCAIWKDQVPGMKIQKALHRMRVNSSNSNEFVYYRLLLSGRNGELSKHFIGSTIKHLTGVGLKQVEFSFPVLEEQRKIAAVLSVLDAKIDCNNRINAELDMIAKTLYDYWFVQFDFPCANGKPYKSSGGKMVYNTTLKREIPEGWMDGTLNDLGQIVGGSTPSTKNPDNFTAKGTPWITPNDLSDTQGNKFITRGAQDVSDEGIKDASLKKYPAGTVLLSSRAPIGYMAIARAELTTNQGFKSFIPSSGYSSAFIYYTVRNSLKEITQYASGSTFKEVSAAVLKTVKITRPERSVVANFTERVEPLFRRQDLLEQENQQLTQLRDWLLPMLMNGQVKLA
ncbi:restriction endonuclease subunit S [Pseudomonas syringae]